MAKNEDHKKLYKGSFKDRVPRFDDGGYISYASAGPSANYMYDNSAPVTTDLGGALSDTSIGGANGNATENDLEHEANAANGAEINNLNTGNSSSSSGSGQSGTSQAAGALGSILKSLGLGSSSSSNASLVNALLGLTSAAGAYKTNKAAATLPTMPSMPGGANTTGLGVFAPTNLAAANAAGSTGIGTGNAPLTQTNYNATKPAASYYTYGSGPESQFFQQVNTGGGPITPVTTNMKKGGHAVKRYDMGGNVGFGTGMSPVTPRPMNPVPAPQGAPAAQTPTPAAPTARPAMPAPAQAPAAVTAPATGALTRPAPAPAASAPQSTMMQRMSMASPNRPAAATMGQPVRPQLHMADGGSSAPGFGIGPGGYNVAPAQITQSQLMHGSGNGLNRGPRQVGVSTRIPMASGGALSGVSSDSPSNSRHIQGPGDGTSDSIPARLANGEYVLSADVVSGLGNGDNGSGAQKLDEFVKNLRKHKAQNASKGTLPADAKPIPHYMGKSK